MAALISEQANFEDGIRHAQEAIQGSCSLLVLTEKGIYAARDRLGRTPLAIGRRDGARAVSSETCAFPEPRLRNRALSRPRRNRAHDRRGR